jgi:hypothetical protein
MVTSKDDARGTVEEKLRKQQLTKPMSEREVTAFCNAMVKNLEMKSKGALSEVRGWVERWQSTWSQSK